MLEGLLLYKKGSKTALWDAIELFSKASMVNQEDGVASYWIAKSYEKKDNKDHDLIIEAYEDSLNKILPEQLRLDAQASKKAAFNNKKKNNTTRNVQINFTNCISTLCSIFISIGMFQYGNYEPL